MITEKGVVPVKGGQFKVLSGEQVKDTAQGYRGSP